MISYLYVKALQQQNNVNIIVVYDDFCLPPSHHTPAEIIALAVHLSGTQSYKCGVSVYENYITSLFFLGVISLNVFQ